MILICFIKKMIFIAEQNHLFSAKFADFKGNVSPGQTLPENGING